MTAMGSRDMRNLPAPVLERLASVEVPTVGDHLRLGLDVHLLGRRGSPVVEERLTRELRVESDGEMTSRHVGYATVYDAPYEVAGGPPWGWTETIVSGAADKSVRERDDVRYLFNHDGMPLARVAARTLTLESDAHGLVSDATVDLRRSDAHDLTLAIERGEVDAMSFAFRAIRQEWNDDYTERWITEVQVFDTSAVTFPANPATVISARGDDAGEHVEGVPVSHARAILELLGSRVPGA